MGIIINNSQINNQMSHQEAKNSDLNSMKVVFGKRKITLAIYMWSKKKSKRLFSRGVYSHREGSTLDNFT